MSSSNFPSPNPGDIKRGDREDFGDLEARPDETAYNVVHGSGDAELDELTVLDADDPELGLTNIGETPPDDWAADTGPTVTGEERDPYPQKVGTGRRTRAAI
jgi:hypothetical protein